MASVTLTSDLHDLATSTPDLRDRLIETSIAAEQAWRTSLRRFALAGFVTGGLAGGLLGTQAVLSEGWATGTWFILGICLPAGFLGALLAAPGGILRGLARRRQVIRDSGFTIEQIEAAVAAELARPSRD